MMFASKLIVLAFALWLLAVSIMMVTRPQLMIKVLRKMGSTPLIHFGELSARFVVGMAIYKWGTAAEYESVVKIAGAFLSVTALILMVIPRRWHHQYALWWARRLSPWMVRVASPLSFITGLIIIKSLL